jgi:glucose dehydrogenase
MDLVTGEVGLHSAPIIVNDVVVIGAAHLAGGVPKSKSNQKGYVRGFDARTGRRLWLFHTIPRPGEFGNDTWQGDSWSYTGNTGVWAQMSADPELGLVYLPVELPTGDYYGGHRPGNGLFGESIVAVDVKTGLRKWHYQLVHHGIWDMDIPCAPILADINVNGRTIKAVAQPTKQGWVYVFDRATGQPVWPIEERPVEKGDVQGEWYSPTQPFVTQAAGVRAPGRQRSGSDRLHAGTQRTGEADHRQLQDRSAVHAARDEHVAEAAWHPHLARCDRWRQLAGWLARSRDQHPVHLLELWRAGARSHSSAGGTL